MRFNSRARKGATTIAKRIKTIIDSFNSRARKGATPRNAIGALKIFAFQLTRP